jgi:hypothetical protein
VECILAGKITRKRDRGSKGRNRGSKGSKGRGAAKGPGAVQRPGGGVEVSAQAHDSTLLESPNKVRQTGVSREKVIEKFRAKKPVYSNCRMLALDGSELATCDLKKLQWYVTKGLGQWVEGHGEESEQPTVQLCFEHKQEDQVHGLSAFYTESRKNQCVGCGEEGHYVKYRCAPLFALALVNILA